MQDRQPPLDVFVGREAELARAAEVMTRVRAGQPWLVAIEGDPGIGKTALARRCLTRAAGLRVLPTRSGQAEADLDFGLAGQLLRAAGGRFPDFPPAGGTGSPASSFAVGAQLLQGADGWPPADEDSAVIDLEWQIQRVGEQPMPAALRRNG